MNRLHLVRHGEALRIATDRLNEKNFYAVNPGFDKQQRVEAKPFVPTAENMCSRPTRCERTCGCD